MALLDTLRTTIDKRKTRKLSLARRALLKEEIQEAIITLHKEGNSLVAISDTLNEVIAVKFPPEEITIPVALLKKGLPEGAVQNGNMVTYSRKSQFTPGMIKSVIK